jgi:peptidoglycan/LPS O-acetylase OafA/YrhL
MATTKLLNIPQLDGVRAIAAIMVMLFHFTQDYPLVNYPIVQKASFIGQTGVALFFVLSGFLITRILITSKSSENYYRNFYIRRALRIFPLYYFFLFLYFFVLNPLVFKHQWPFYFYFQNIVMTFHDTLDGPRHLWSLAVEEHFYLIWPFLVYIIDIKHLKKWLISLITLTFVVRVIMYQQGYPLFYFTLSRLDDLCLGALLAVLYIQKDSILKIFQSSYYFPLFAGFILCFFTLWYFTKDSTPEIMQVLRYFFVGFIYFLLMGFVIYDNGKLSVLLKNESLVYIGKISYGIYVYHPIVFELCKKYLCSKMMLVNLLSHFAISILVASLSYHLIEVQFLKLKRYFN